MAYKFLNWPYQGFFFLTHFILLRNILIPINNIYFRVLCFNVIINILFFHHHIIIVFCNLTAVIYQIHCVIILQLFPHPKVVPLNG